MIMMQAENSALKDSLLKTLREKQATICVVGLGYVGLPLALAYAEKGYKVLGLDVDESKVNKLREEKSYIKHILDSRIKVSIVTSKLIPSTDFSLVTDADALILCVPTPLNDYREPDLSFIRATLSMLKPYLRKGQILSLESTTYPGTTEEELRPCIEDCGFTIGEDFFLVYSPEREDPGNPNFNTTTIPKVLGGSTTHCADVGEELYSAAIQTVVRVSSTQTAEMTKLLENIHRAVNIGLMNELKPLSDKMNIDLYEVIRAAATKPFGFVPYYPGPGLGGHCIPIDPFYLTWKARQYGMHTRFIELAGEINTSMPLYVLQKTADALNERGMPLKNSKVLVLGIAYKKNVDDMRESPSVEIIEELLKKKADVSYSDPFFNTFPAMRNHVLEMNSVELSAEALASFDAVILATDHDQFDYKAILAHSKVIIDTRGRFNPDKKVIRS